MRADASNRRSGDVDKAIRKNAASQFGLICREQAIAIGMSPSAIARRVKSGAWIAEFPGVFRLAGTPSSWQGRVYAALLWLGDDGLISHLSAGAIWKFEGIVAGSVDVTVTRRAWKPEGVKVHFTRSLTEADISSVGPFRVTSPTRTLVDLASVVSPEQLETALDDALRRGLTSIPRLKWALKTCARGRRGAKVLHQFIEERDPRTRGSESRLETRLLRLIRSAKLPLPVSQYEIRDKGRFVARPDLSYPESRLILEADGYKFHSGLKRWQNDLKRNNELVRLGWRVLHITRKDLLENQTKIVETIRQMLGNPGNF